MKKLISFVLPITWLPTIKTGWGHAYVAIPKGHPLFGKNYDDINVSVHGGITFADESIDGQPKKTEGMWIVGFDCCHSGDTPSTCPKEYVEAEAERLREQLENYVVVKQTFTTDEVLKLIRQADHNGLPNQRPHNSDEGINKWINDTLK